MLPPDDDDEPTGTDVLSIDAGAAPHRLRIAVISGPDRGAELLLVRGTYLVGKAPGCALVLRDPAVSRQHLELAVVEGGLRVRDLGSRNGSLFGGARFSEITVGSGAVIQLGRTELRVLPEGVRDALPPSTRDHFGGLLGRSLAMRELFAVLERVAPSDVAVLIEGETGTGKELCAEAIHAASRRAGKPFIVCDLAGVARSLVESELFGHVRGAFTGADRDREGAFVQADAGTIFIDEIGELDLELQPRLLRALERRQVKPVGGSAYRTVDVRVVAATNRDLQSEVRAGRFREDLYHRLAVVRVRLPSLRERKEDIPLLAQHFLSKYTQKMNKHVTGISNAAIVVGVALAVPPSCFPISSASSRMRAWRRSPALRVTSALSRPCRTLRTVTSSIPCSCRKRVTASATSVAASASPPCSRAAAVRTRASSTAARAIRCGSTC